MATPKRLGFVVLLGFVLCALGCGNGNGSSGTGGGGAAGANQLSMYENLVFSDDYPTPGQLADDDLVPDYFKDEAFLPESSFDSTPIRTRLTQHRATSSTGTTPKRRASGRTTDRPPTA